jgi:1,4-alpha-glucan branching enzyme
MAKAKHSSGADLDSGAKANGSAASAPNQAVEFVLICLGAQHVYLSGDFNGWQPAGLRMIEIAGTGMWKKRLVLPPGRHEYKYVMDGKWLHDPEAQENVRNVYGSLNSVLQIHLE